MYLSYVPNEKKLALWYSFNEVNIFILIFFIKVYMLS